jgi:hypothetical protein
MTKSTSLLKAAWVAMFITPFPDLSLGAGSVKGQVAPAVEWRSVDWSDDRPTTGQYFTWDGTDWIPDNTPQPADQEREESGEEWWFGVCNMYEHGQHIGYLTTGYGSWPNYGFENLGCVDLTLGDGVPQELEALDHVKGITRGVVACYDLNGNILWYRSLLPGVLYNVIQDSEGNVIVAGAAYSNAEPDDLGADDEAEPPPPILDIPILYNDNTTDLSATGLNCGQLGGNVGFKQKACIAKLTRTGEVIWVHLYGAEAAYQDAWQHSSLFEDLIELPDGGSPAYFAVGRSGKASVAGDYPLAVHVAADGGLLTKHWYDPADPIWPTGTGVENPITLPNAGEAKVGWFTSVTKDPNSSKLLIAGYFRTVVFSPLEVFNQAYVVCADAALDPYSMLWMHYTGNTNDPLVALAGIAVNKLQYTTGGGFVGNKVVWPVLANFDPSVPANDIFAGISVSELRVLGLDALTGAWQWTKNLREVRAYDLQADIVATQDGNVAVVSSKWPPPYSQAGQHFDWSELPQDAQDCLLNSFGYDPPGASELQVDWAIEETGVPISTFAINPDQFYGYWNTNAYVAKLDPSNGALLWETQFDAEPDNGFDCTPGDLRNQECMYKVVEAADGGLVVCGNTSHNFDDYYLAKLTPDCQSRLDYSLFESGPGSNNGQPTYTVAAGGETWNQDYNIHRRIIIPAGVRLTIAAGTTISFADSKFIDHPCGVVVESGGELLLEDNATLTSLAGCPSTMWDGVLVQGDPTRSQDEPGHIYQGLLAMNKATIANARVGALAANSYPAQYTMAALAPLASGGIMKVDRGTFSNCSRDVVLSPYENHAPGNSSVIAVNRSRFTRAQFAVSAPLNDGTAPREHALLFGVRGVQFNGCSFAGTLFYNVNFPAYQQTGTGISALNSSFMVGAKCTVAIPLGGTCPGPNYFPSTFDLLGLGIKANGFDPGKTFSVNEVSFTNCPANIRMEGITNAAVTGCSFDVVDFVNPFTGSTPYGLYSDQCTGYEIEDNTIAASLPSSRARAGIVIKDSGPESNEIYNNRIHGFGDRNSTAIVIQGMNANTSDPLNLYDKGLQIKCNEFGQFGPLNAFDVALTTGNPTIRKNQGRTTLTPSDVTAPAGNLFSDHSTSNDPESDWHVSISSPLQVRYYHHNGLSNDPWVPQYFDITYLAPLPTLVNWPPNRAQACPSNQRSRERQRSSMESGSSDRNAELEDSKDAYDATKDNGDTYSLLAYVSDATKSSVQVRNALQSVAPKVSFEVWQSAFERTPALTEWPLTQALLSNSPLQPEVLKLCYESTLSDFYYNLIAAAQSGTNPLSVLESDIAYFAAAKAENLTDLGRWSWLDSADVDTAITLLKLWHEQLPADNENEVLAGYYTTKNDMASLYSLASGLESAVEQGGVYGLLKRYASETTGAGWLTPTQDTKGWLETLAQQREVQGSAKAAAWLEALGGEQFEEVIVLPVVERRSNGRVRAANSPEPLILDAFPNPSNGFVYVVCNVPMGTEHAALVVRDLNGRLLQQIRIGPGPAMVELDLSTQAAGIYMASLELDGVRAGQVKLAIQ